MKAAVIHQANGAPEYGDFDKPVPHHGEALVGVTASALSRAPEVAGAETRDSATMSVAFVPGSDGIGSLDNGNGRRVAFAFPTFPFGSLSEWTVLPRANCVDVPEELDDMTAAAIVNPGMFCWAALTERAKFQPGEAVLVNGASGSSGRLAIQIAKHLGAGKVLATCSSLAHARELAKLGADAIIALDLPEEELKQTFAQELHQGRVTVILDYLWDASTEMLLEVISDLPILKDAPNVRYVEVESSASYPITLRSNVFRSPRIEILGVGNGSVPSARLIRALADVLKAAVRANLTTEFVRFPLHEIKSAWNQQTDKRILIMA
jgi:NADPH:quinone reductase-like Zn-dependent oxidoreductase